MGHAEPEFSPSFALDEYTNRFLTEYPVNCQLRTAPLSQRMLHAHNGFEFYFCLDGSGSYIVGDRLYPLKAGTLTIIRPHVVHRPFTGKTEPLHRFVVSIDEAYMDAIKAACFGSALPISSLFIDDEYQSAHYFLSTPQQSKLANLLSELELQLQNKTPYGELAVLKSIAELLMLIIELQKTGPAGMNPAESEDERIVGGVLSYLTAHYQEKLQVEDLLRLYPVSRSRLFYIFKEATGNTIKQFLTDYRLNQAKRLLVESAIPVSEIALLTGFGDMSHFFHVFKRGTGLSPKKYRSEAAGSVKRQSGTTRIT
ncbi:helix-turn-helix domain-containing protein [Paenibacillus sepulcri]|uniref:AraC family transcriptional regulator n=1 Tax=Paenibacillus sepulcri TaxID=359917 RepID=A0ABS7C9D4_9BACL|nr:AraC family transcriptional regulator [Paenibacillus sepulcri]